eukprot:gb/GEZJ01005767.1/.p1 GENE.gb/GEZJ01005767.1/~~gb/GEZJ01005767.1/.p1  ORF type:complete len:146 (+),score=11.85 gb/GEZJ01005767.1/:575-1012(+)
MFSSFKSHLNMVSAEIILVDSNTNIDMFLFMALLGEPFFASFKREIHRAGFRRAGLWPVASNRLLGVQRPANSMLNKTLSVGALEETFQKRCIVYKEKVRTVLGSDAQILNCGYVDTKNGCVITSETVTDMARSKHATDVIRRDQ